MNIFRVRKTFFNKCILQFYSKGFDSKHSSWVDVPYFKAPTQLIEDFKNINADE